MLRQAGTIIARFVFTSRGYRLPCRAVYIEVKLAELSAGVGTSAVADNSATNKLAYASACAPSRENARTPYGFCDQEAP